MCKIALLWACRKGEWYRNSGWGFKWGVNTHPSVPWGYFLQSCCPASQSPPWRDSQGWSSPHSGFYTCLFWTSWGFWCFYLQLVVLPLNVCLAFTLPPLWCHLQVCPSCWWAVGVKAQLLSQRGWGSFPSVTQTCCSKPSQMMKTDKNPLHICPDSTRALFLFQHFGAGRSNWRMADSPSPQVGIGAGLQHLCLGI